MFAHPEENRYICLVNEPKERGQICPLVLF